MGSTSTKVRSGTSRPSRAVHLAERTPGGAYLNPLHPGALAPLAKTPAPTIDRILAERNRHPLNPNALTEIVDLIAETHDLT